ncbi:MAG: acyltransferase [Hymenobacter sp.]|nr:MAG: acyltransferase [Hymenobacter sp.]
MSTNALTRQTAYASAGKAYFVNLDFLRVVAFSAVFALHARLAETMGLLSNNEFYHRVLRLASDGVLGVSFFFVLSGFLITYLLLAEKAQTGRIALRDFYLRRTLRIWPLYLAVVIFGTLIYPILKSLLGSSTEFSNRIAYYYSFLSNFDYIYLVHHGLSGKSLLMLTVTWSVAIEEQFYLLWPLLFIVAPKRYYQGIFYVTILASLSFRYLHWTDAPTLTYHTLSVALDLAIGGLCAWYSRNSPSFLHAIEHLPRVVVAGIYGTGLLMLLYRTTHYATPVAAVLDRVICAVFFAFVLLEQNFCRHSPIKFSRFRYTSALGKYTYGLYLLHPIALQLTTLLFLKLHYAVDSFKGGLLHATVAFGLVLPLAYASYHYFESPFLKLKNKFTHTKAL